jgi:dipeptidyl aminopeptidase/acylaminoacyl peptidase
VTNGAANDELPAWSPGWTWLTFVSDRTGNADIFAIRADCNAVRSDERDCGLVQLTDDPADDLLPAWSPDGRWIAFVSTRDGNPEIYLMRRDGSDLRRLTDDPGGDWRPAWLPDGSGLVFTSNRAGSNDLYRLTLDEDMRPGDLTQLTASPGDERDPSVAPDGTIYYVVGAGESLQIASLWPGGALPSAGSGANAIGGNAATPGERRPSGRAAACRRSAVLWGKGRPGGHLRRRRRSGCRGGWLHRSPGRHPAAVATRGYASVTQPSDAVDTLL